MLICLVMFGNKHSDSALAKFSLKFDADISYDEVLNSMKLYSIVNIRA